MIGGYDIDTRITHAHLVRQRSHGNNASRIHTAAISYVKYRSEYSCRITHAHSREISFTR